MACRFTLLMLPEASESSTQNHLRVFRETATPNGLNLWGECLGVGFYDDDSIGKLKALDSSPLLKDVKGGKEKNSGTHTHTHTAKALNLDAPHHQSLHTHTAEALRSEQERSRSPHLPFLFMYVAK